MNCTRTGKIACLPQAVREELNRRLADGQNGGKILDWINSLPEVRKVLEEEFKGEPVTKMNLSRWRQGGFREWQLEERTWRLAKELMREDPSAFGGHNLGQDPAADLLVFKKTQSRWFAAKMAVMANETDTAESGEDQRRAFRFLSTEAARVERIAIAGESLELRKVQVADRHAERRAWHGEKPVVATA